jgi:hypothetical protein
VAHDAQKVVPHRKRIVGPGAFGAKVLVRLLAFVRQQGDVLSTFLAKGFVRVRSLFSQDLVFQRSLLHDHAERFSDRRSGRRLIVRLRPCSRQHIVGQRPSPADDGVRRLVDERDVFLGSLIRLLALDAQAFVGLLTLCTGLRFLEVHIQSFGDGVRGERSSTADS